MSQSGGQKKTDREKEKKSQQNIAGILACDLKKTNQSVVNQKVRSQKDKESKKNKKDNANVHSSFIIAQKNTPQERSVFESIGSNITLEIL